jgi:hypothetical protein
MLIHALFDADVLEYPPAALSTIPHTLTGLPYGNGEYTASASSVYDTSLNNRIINAFDKTVNNNAWVSSNNVYSTTNGTYTGSVETNTTSGKIFGEWLQIELPESIPVQTIRLSSRTGAGYSPPLEFTLVASNDIAGNWVNIFSTDFTTDPDYSGDGVFSSGETVLIDIGSGTAYKNYRIIVERVLASPTFQRFTAIGELALLSFNYTNALIYRNPSLYGTFKINIIGLYVDRYNFATNKDNLLYISSPQLFVPGSGSRFLILHEEPVSGDTSRKDYHLFSDDFELVTQLNGFIELRFRRGNVDAYFQRALLVMQADKI